MDEDLIEKKISSEVVFDGKLLHVYRDSVQLPNEKEAVREWIAHNGASAVVPILPNGDVVLVRQYRYPIGKVTIEIPAGKLDTTSESPLTCVRRELEEETGYHAKKITKLTTIATTVGFSNEYIHLYVAEELTAGTQHPDEDEFLNVVRIPLKEAVEMAKDGRIYDAKSVISLLMLSDRVE